MPFYVKLNNIFLHKVVYLVLDNHLIKVKLKQDNNKLIKLIKEDNKNKRKNKRKNKKKKKSKSKSKNKKVNKKRIKN
jgi:hypothetical protein